MLGSLNGHGSFLPKVSTWALLMATARSFTCFWQWLLFHIKNGEQRIWDKMTIIRSVRFTQRPRFASAKSFRSSILTRRQKDAPCSNLVLIVLPFVIVIVNTISRHTNVHKQTHRCTYRQMRWHTLTPTIRHRHTHTHTQTHTHTHTHRERWPWQRWRGRRAPLPLPRTLAPPPPPPPSRTFAKIPHSKLQNRRHLPHNPTDSHYWWLITAKYATSS